MFEVGYEVYLKLAEGTEKGDRLLDNFTDLSITEMRHYFIAGDVTLLSFPTGFAGTALHTPSYLHDQ